MARQLRRTMAGNQAVAQPARKAPAKAPARPALRPNITTQGRGVGKFLTEVRSELRKVVWPTRREATNLTLLVVGISVAVGFVLGFIDYAFSELFRLLLG